MKIESLEYYLNKAFKDTSDSGYITYIKFNYIEDNKLFFDKIKISYGYTEINVCNMNINYSYNMICNNICNVLNDNFIEISKHEFYSILDKLILV